MKALAQVLSKKKEYWVPSFGIHPDSSAKNRIPIDIFSESVILGLYGIVLPGDRTKRGHFES